MESLISVTLTECGDELEGDVNQMRGVSTKSLSSEFDGVHTPSSLDEATALPVSVANSTR
jgi:hypothetical protein